MGVSRYGGSYPTTRAAHFRAYGAGPRRAAHGQGRSHAVRLAQEEVDIVAVDICAQLPWVPYETGTREELDETVELVRQAGRDAIAVVADIRESCSRSSQTASMALTGQACTRAPQSMRAWFAVLFARGDGRFWAVHRAQPRLIGEIVIDLE